MQTLDKLLHLVLRDKKCPSDGCARATLRYRSAEEGRLVLKDHEFGLDVVMFAGEQYHREHLSIPKVHKLLRDGHHVPICERSIGNLIDGYETLCECVAGDTDRLQAKLQKQGALVLSVDGVQYDDRSPVLYVQREVLSGEVLYAERRLARAAKDLVPMLRRTAEMARQLGVPILGIVSDKERSLVPAIGEVFPDIPHQFCQQHFLGNVARPLEEDDERLQEGVREVVSSLRDVQREIERRFPVSAGEEMPRERSEQPAPADRMAKRVVGEPTPPTRPPPPPAAAGREPPVGPGVGGRRLDPVASEGTSTLAPIAPAGGPGDPPVTPLTSAAAQEAAVASALAGVGVTVGKVSGRPSLDPVGRKRFLRLQEVREIADQAVQKKRVNRVAGL